MPFPPRPLSEKASARADTPEVVNTYWQWLESRKERIRDYKKKKGGLRYPVEFLLELLSSDMTSEQILADYPDLEPDDLRAACAYGARLSRVQRVEPLAA